MELSIIIPTLNRRDTLVPCLESAIRNTNVDFEIIVYANSCEPETRDLLREYPGVRAIEDQENRFFTDAVNEAIIQSSGRFVFLLNDDCELRNAQWFPFYKALLDMDENIAMLGPHHHFPEILPYGWVEPFASMYRRETLDLIGLLPKFDDSFVLWWSDIYHSYHAMNMGMFPMALEPVLVDRFVEHKRCVESGDTVLQFRNVLPSECFEFHGKSLMYERLGIKDESRLAGLYGGRIWGADDVEDIVKNIAGPDLLST